MTLLYDASHTSHTAAQTGIQRVCRALFTELAAGGDTRPVCYDPYRRAWRALQPAEDAVLRDRAGGAGKSRGAKWPWTQRLAGMAQRWVGRRADVPPADGLICPEIFSPRVAAHLSELFAEVPRGPRVAIFHDAIALKFPEYTPAGTVARFPGYLRELLAFDAIAAVSEDSAQSLRDYWRWLGVDQTPPVQAIPLGIEQSRAPAATDIPPGRSPRLLSVGTIEGRKNHLALLEACETLWREGVRFELQLVGMARPDTAGAALARMQALQQAGRPVLFRGAVSEAELHAAYRQCSFTIYPSLIEGFGMPVLESLQYGKPCICSGRGALGESAHGGGCVTLDVLDATTLAGAMRELLCDPAALARLSDAARHRRLKRWPDYAAEIRAWMQTVARR